MKFIETGISGASAIELQPSRDERGYFARSWSRQAFAERGMNAELDECSISYNKQRGTLRGMHYQAEPDEEAKLVTCIRGRIFDVIIDLRRDSPSYLQWFGTELSLENGRMLYVPEGVAHGFLTLESETYLHYQIAGRHRPSAARGVRWDDPRFGIDWPEPPTVISERDRNFEDFKA